MPTGLFGKLPAKRDFIAMNAPRRFLDAYEPWIQGGMATARLRLGDGFAATYNSAPLWRFWIGAELAGEASIGVWMASVDGVGRSFPLTVMFSDGANAPPPPELDSNDEWFEAAEETLLGALGEGATFDDLAIRVGALAAPRLKAAGDDAGAFRELDDGGVLLSDAAANWSLGFRAAGRYAQRRSLARQSFWWTLGGGAMPSLALATPNWPSARRFEDFLTGRFDPQVQTRAGADA